MGRVIPMPARFPGRPGIMMPEPALASPCVRSEVGSGMAAARHRLLGKLNTAPSRTPAEGQRWVMVLRLV